MTAALRRIGPYLILLASAVFWLSPHTIAGLSSRGDLEFHHDATLQFSESLGSGVLHPSWAWKAYDGLGTPVFIYYPPLFHYTWHLVHRVVGDSWLSIFLIETASTFLIGLILYLALRRCGAGARLALIAGIAGSSSPFVHMTLLYAQGPPWHLAYPFMATCFLSVVMVMQARPRFSVVVALSAFLLTATHVLSSLMVMLCLPFAVLPYVLFEGDRVAALKRAAVAAASALLGLLLACFHLWPALRLADLMNTEGYAQDVDWRTGFALPLFTVTRWAVFQWAMATLLALMLVYGIAVLVSRRARIDSLWLVTASCVGFGLGALLFSSEVSLPLWQASARLRVIQYPYRFFSVLSIAATLGVALALYPRDGHAPRDKIRTVAGAALLGLSLLFSLAIQGKFFMVDGQPLATVIDDAVAPARSYLPATARPLVAADYLAQGGFDAECRRAGATATVVESLPERRRWQVTSLDAWRARLPLFAYPFWTVSIAGVPADWTVDAPTGLLAVDLPAGTVPVELAWQRPAARRQGLLISGVGVLGLVALCFLVFRRGVRASAPGHGSGGGPGGTVTA